MEYQRMFESSSKSRYSGRIAVCNSTKYCRVDFKMRSGNRHILRAFGKLETVRMFDDTRKAHSLGCVLNHSQKVYASSSYGSSGDSLSNNRPLSSRVIPTQMGDRQAYNSKPGNSKLGVHHNNLYKARTQGHTNEACSLDRAQTWQSKARSSPQ